MRTRSSTTRSAYWCAVTLLRPFAGWSFGTGDAHWKEGDILRLVHCWMSVRCQCWHLTQLLEINNCLFCFWFCKANQLWNSKSLSNIMHYATLTFKCFLIVRLRLLKQKSLVCGPCRIGLSINLYFLAFMNSWWLRNKSKMWLMWLMCLDLKRRIVEPVQKSPPSSNECWEHAEPTFGVQALDGNIPFLISKTVSVLPGHLGRLELLE